MLEFAESKKKDRKRRYHAGMANSACEKKQLSKADILMVEVYENIDEIGMISNGDGYKSYALPFMNKESASIGVIQGKFTASTGEELSSEEIEYLGNNYFSVMSELLTFENKELILSKLNLRSRGEEAGKQEYIKQGFNKLEDGITSLLKNKKEDFNSKKEEEQVFDIGDILLQYTEDYKEIIIESPFLRFAEGVNLGKFSEVRKTFLRDSMTLERYSIMKKRIFDFLEKDQEYELRPRGLDKNNIEKLSSERRGHSESMRQGGRNRVEGADSQWDVADSFVQEKAKSGDLPSVVELCKIFVRINELVVGNQKIAQDSFVHSFRLNDISFRDAGDGFKKNISGVNPAQIVSIVYSVMDSIALKMKGILGIEDEKKKNGAVINLAAMAYEVLLSVHAFDDDDVIIRTKLEKPNKIEGLH